MDIDDPHSPPRNEVPVTVAFDTELMADDVALFCSGLHVYSTGFRVRLELRVREWQRSDRVFEAFHGDGPDRVLVGVEYADGRWGKNVARWTGPHTLVSDGEVSVMDRGGSGSDGTADADYFIAPLPPPGPARLVCAWPSRGLGDTVTELPVDEIAAASERVRQLWPVDHGTREPLRPAAPDVPGGSWFAR